MVKAVIWICLFRRITGAILSGVTEFLGSNFLNAPLERNDVVIACCVNDMCPRATTCQKQYNETNIHFMKWQHWTDVEK